MEAGGGGGQGGCRGNERVRSPVCCLLPEGASAGRGGVACPRRGGGGSEGDVRVHGGGCCYRGTSESVSGGRAEVRGKSASLVMRSRAAGALLFIRQGLLIKTFKPN